MPLQLTQEGSERREQGESRAFGWVCVGHQTLYTLKNGNFNECHVVLVPCKMIPFLLKLQVTKPMGSSANQRRGGCNNAAELEASCERYQSDVNQHTEQIPKRTSRISVSVSLDKQKFEVNVTF